MVRKAIGRPSDSRGVLREAASMLVGLGEMLQGLATNSRSLDEVTLLKEMARAIRRDAMAASRRLDRAARALRVRAQSGERT